MSELNGVWATDVLGIEGWERTGITFLQDGHVHGGSADFYHFGNYSVDDRKVKISLNLKSHSGRKQVYGKKRKEFAIKMKGKRNGDVIEGKASLLDPGSYDIAYIFRLIRLCAFRED